MWRESSSAGIILGGFVLLYVLILAAILLGLLARAVAVLTELVDDRATIREYVGREPTDAEWAEAVTAWAFDLNDAIELPDAPEQEEREP